MQKRRSKNAVWPAWEWRRPSDSELICSQHWKLTNNRQFGSSCRRYLLLFAKRSMERGWGEVKYSPSIRMAAISTTFHYANQFYTFYCLLWWNSVHSFWPESFKWATRQSLFRCCPLQSPFLSLSLLLPESTPALSTGIIAALKSFRVQIFN